MGGSLHAKQIEIFSVNHLKIELVKTGYLDPNINVGDKEPSWDGVVYVHESEKEYTKKNVRKVAVQVKGKFCEELNRSRIVYPVSIIDLHNFLQDGGVIYFVIYVNTEEYNIFYAQLEPIKIKELLNEVTNTQKTKNIWFSKLPKGTIEKVNIFKNFLFNRKKQMSFIDEEIYTLDDIMDMKGSELTFTLSGLHLNKDNLQQYIDSNNVYMYARFPTSPVLVPISGKIKELIEIEQANLNIGINGNVYYNEQTMEKSKDTIHLKFGDSFEFVLNPTTHHNSFSYKITNSLRKALLDLEFLILMQKNKGFEINEKFIDLSIAIDKATKFNFEKYYKQLEFYQNMVSLLEYLNITDDINCEQLTDREWQDIDTLIKGLLHKEEVALKDGLQTFHIIKVQEFNIPLVINRQNNGLYIIEELFHIRKSNLYLSLPPSEKAYNVPVFRSLTAEQLVQCSSLNFEILLEEYKRLHSPSNNILFDANHFLLRMISAADLCDVDSEIKDKFLQASHNIVMWLQEECKLSADVDMDILKLNELQIAKRRRKLTSGENEWLFELSEDTSRDEMLKFGAYVLLDEGKRAERIFSRFTDQQKEHYKQYPIYILFEDLKSE